MKYKNGEDFLNKLYINMHMSDEVMHSANKNDSPEKKIEKYLDRLEKVHDIAKTNSHKMDLLKEFYYDKYVIKELPESYVKLQQKIAREQGYGDTLVTSDMKEKMLESIQTDQRKSLDSWIEYLSSDDAMYPMWFKNYAFQGILKLGQFDKEKGEYTKRTKSTTSPYIELNREVLSYVYNTLINEIGKDELTEEQEKAIENGESFKKLYTYYLTKQGFTSNDKETDGIWVKYEQGSDSKKLCDSLQGKNTGWCTAGYEVAKTQLEGGDFYVYYTKDETGEYTNPRIAIRMDGHDSIGEVRGVAKEQNLESNMLDIADKKLDEFPDKEKYKKKVHDMKVLTEIENKVNHGIELSINELIFLYEIDEKIEGFGFDKDPRIKEIRNRRNNIDDLNQIFEGKKEIKGSIDLNYLKTAKGLILPESIEGDLNLNSLETAEGLTLPRNIEGSLILGGLTNAKGLILPDYIGKTLNLKDLVSAKDLVLPKKIGKNLYLFSLKSAKDLILPESIGGNLALGLTSAKGLELPKKIGKNLELISLRSAKGLTLPKHIDGDLALRSLTSAKDLKLPKNIEGSLALFSLRSAEELVLPDSIGGDLFLGLTSAKGLKLPENIGGRVFLRRLKNYEELTLPHSYKDSNIRVGPFVKIKYIPDEEYFGVDSNNEIIEMLDDDKKEQPLNENNRYNM